MMVFLRQVIDIQAECEQSYSDATGWISQELKRRLEWNSSQAEKRSLYLATCDAGVDASIKFWKDVEAQGAGLVNPADFPLTLANSAAAVTARELDIQGPNFTLIGHEEAVYGIFEQALEDMHESDGEQNESLLLAVDLSERARCSGIVLTTQEAATSSWAVKLTADPSFSGPLDSAKKPSLILAEFVDDLVRNHSSRLEAIGGSVLARAYV